MPKSLPKPPMSRFPIHDELSAPPGSVPLIKSATDAGGRLPNLIGVLAGSPAALRGYARMRSELRRGALPAPARERVALAVAAHYGSEAGLRVHRRAARAAGLGVDEIDRAQRFDSVEQRFALLLSVVRGLLERRGLPADGALEAARDAGWTDEHLVEAIALVSLESFAAMVHVAGGVPADGAVEANRDLRAVA